MRNDQGNYGHTGPPGEQAGQPAEPVEFPTEVLTGRPLEPDEWRAREADAWSQDADAGPWPATRSAGQRLDDGPLTDPSGFTWGSAATTGWRHTEPPLPPQEPPLSEPEELAGPGGAGPEEPMGPEGPDGPAPEGEPGGPAGPPRAARSTTIALVTALVVVVLVTGVLGTIAVLMTSQPDVPLGVAPPRRLATTIHFAPVTGVRAAPCPGAEAVLDDTSTTCYQLAPGVTVTSVLKVEAVAERDDKYAVRVVLPPESRDRVSDLTRDSLDQQLAVVVSDRVVAAPRVAQPLTVDSLSISGFTKDQADSLVGRLLGTGAAPAPSTCPPTDPNQAQPGVPNGQNQSGVPNGQNQPGAPTSQGQPGGPSSPGQPGGPVQNQPATPTLKASRGEFPPPRASREPRLRASPASPTVKARTRRSTPAARAPARRPRTRTPSRTRTPCRPRTRTRSRTRGRPAAPARREAQPPAVPPRTGPAPCR